MSIVSGEFDLMEKEWNERERQKKLKEDKRFWEEMERMKRDTTYTQPNPTPFIPISPYTPKPIPLMTYPNTTTSTFPPYNPMIGTPVIGDMTQAEDLILKKILDQSFKYLNMLSKEKTREDILSSIVSFCPKPDSDGVCIKQWKDFPSGIFFTQHAGDEIFIFKEEEGMEDSRSEMFGLMISWLQNIHKDLRKN